MMTVGKGRTAGFLYLVVVLTGIFSLAYVPSQIGITGDPAQMVRNIVASEWLFRLGIAASLLCYTAFLLLPLALYRLLHPVSRVAATLMVALAVVSVPIALVALRSKIDVLSLLHTNATPPDQVGRQVMSALASYANGLLLAKLFWGLWLLPLGYLILKSGAVPRVLGILLILGCLGYAVTVFGTLLLPGYAEMPIAGWATRPGAIGEIGTCLWLVVMGARIPPGTTTKAHMDATPAA